MSNVQGREQHDWMISYTGCKLFEGRSTGLVERVGEATQAYGISRKFGAQTTCGSKPKETEQAQIGRGQPNTSIPVVPKVPIWRSGRKSCKAWLCAICMSVHLRRAILRLRHTFKGPENGVQLDQGLPIVQ
jgi:hypothetical protein